MYFINYLFGSGSNDRDNHNPAMQADMLKCTLEWGSFYLPKEDLTDWVKASPGLKDFQVKMSGIKNYNIEPGGGASSAEVTVEWYATRSLSYSLLFNSPVVCMVLHKTLPKGKLCVEEFANGRLFRRGTL
jgi:hypothetical protein